MNFGCKPPPFGFETCARARPRRGVRRGVRRGEAAGGRPVARPAWRGWCWPPWRCGRRLSGRTFSTWTLSRSSG